MKLRLLAACVLTGIAGACARATEPASAPGAAGRYSLASVDGIAGTQSEELALGGDSTYAWRTYQVFPNAYLTKVTLAEVSAGRWEQDRSRLTLADSAGRPPLAGLIRGDTITIQTGGHEFGFARKRPTHLDGAYVLTRYDGHELPFTATDTSGTTRTVGFGQLQLATYSTHALDLWQTIVYPDGSSSTGWVRLSSGPYNWSGATLTLETAVGVSVGTGEWIVGGVLLGIRGFGHEYELAYTTQLPHY